MTGIRNLPAEEQVAVIHRDGNVVHGPVGSHHLAPHDPFRRHLAETAELAQRIVHNLRGTIVHLACHCQRVLLLEYSDEPRRAVGELAAELLAGEQLGIGRPVRVGDLQAAMIEQVLQRVLQIRHRQTLDQPCDRGGYWLHGNPFLCLTVAGEASRLLRV